MNFYDTTERFGLPITQGTVWDGGMELFTEIMQRIMEIEDRLDRMESDEHQH
jgi:hypothetical protein